MFVFRSSKSLNPFAVIFQAFHGKGSAENGAPQHSPSEMPKTVFVSTLVHVIPAPKEARFPRLGQFSLERRLVKGRVIKSYLGFLRRLVKTK